MKKYLKRKFFVELFCHPKKYIYILEFIQYMMLGKMTYIINADIESLIKKQITVKITQKAAKIVRHIYCGYSMTAIWTFDHIKNKHSLYRGKGCMKKFCETLREQPKNIIVFEKEKMLTLTKDELKSHQDATECYIVRKRLLKENSKDNNY